jgi:beta-galactosidase
MHLPSILTIIFLRTDTNFQYPFLVAPPLIPDGMNHVGSYQTQLKIPATWENRRMFLSFEGVSAAFHLWIDGQAVGYSQDSRLPAEFDVTQWCKPGGSHTMSLRVYRFCDGSYLEDQDMWWLSGVHRDVILYSKSSVAHIWDVSAKTEVDLPARNGGSSEAPARLKVDISVRSHALKSADIPSNCSVTASLYGPHMLKPGQTHVDPPAGAEPVFQNLDARFISGERGEGYESGEQLVARLDTSVGPVKLWNAEEPWLYTLVVSLRGEGGNNIADVEVLRIGFKKTVCDGNKFLVNGAVAYMCGVNRLVAAGCAGAFCVCLKEGGSVCGVSPGQSLMPNPCFPTPTQPSTNCTTTFLVCFTRCRCHSDTGSSLLSARV